jgi:hypothetical protein
MMDIMTEERGLYLPLTYNPEQDTVGVYLPADIPTLTDKIVERKSTKKLVLVEAISQYRMRYVVECDALEHAADEVCMERVEDEFSQLHLGEVITSTREISSEEYLRLFDQDNEYLRNWTAEQKFKMIHSIDYEE